MTNFTPHKWIYLEIGAVHYIRPKNPYYVSRPTPEDYSSWTAFERYSKNNTVEISGEFPVKEEYEFDEFEIFHSGHNRTIAIYRPPDSQKKKEEILRSDQTTPASEKDEESNLAILNKILSLTDNPPNSATPDKENIPLAEETGTVYKSILQEIYELAKNCDNYNEFIIRISESRNK